LNPPEAPQAFAEPWQAQAFALAVRLNAEGAFTWAEWAQALARQLAGDPDDDGSRYYHHWVAALEALAAERGLASVDELSRRKAAWADAYRRTPHGRPVELAESVVRPGRREKRDKSPRRERSFKSFHQP
jgi:nitrile hydratase accessory protein